MSIVSYTLLLIDAMSKLCVWFIAFSRNLLTILTAFLSCPNESSIPTNVHNFFTDKNIFILKSLQSSMFLKFVLFTKICFNQRSWTAACTNNSVIGEIYLFSSHSFKFSAVLCMVALLILFYDHH